MLIREQMRRTAMTQSALEMNCRAEDFCADHPIVTTARTVAGARRYIRQPFFCQLASYGGNVVAAVHPDVRQAVEAYLAGGAWYACLETPRLHLLEEALAPYGYQVCFMAEYFLPDPDRVQEKNCVCSLRLMEKGAFDGLYLPAWENALCAARKDADVLALGAYDGEKLVGLAGASADCEEMWQIGIDVLPSYRRRGIAGALTAGLTREIMRRGKVPFYCAAWSNLPSVRNALGAGFYPAWVEVTAKPAPEVARMNGTPVREPAASLDEM